MGLVTSDAVSTGDVGVLAMLVNRQLKVTLYDSTGTELSVGGGTQYTIGTTGSTGNTVTIAGAYRKDTPAALADTTGDVTALQVDASGRLWTNASASTVNVVAVAGTAGGSAIFNKLGTTVYESTTIKTSSGSVYGISGYNNTLNPIYVKLYNTTAAPTTALTALWRGILPATTVTGAAGFVEDWACPVAFSTGIGIKITGGSLTDGDTAVAATTASLYTVNVRYQ
jgi:hypothetical protein